MRRVLPTADQRAVAAIAQAVLDVDAGRVPGWRLDRWGIGHLRSSGSSAGRVFHAVAQRHGSVVHGVALFERDGRVEAMTVTVRDGRVLHVAVPGRRMRWALADPVRRAVAA